MEGSLGEESLTDKAPPWGILVNSRGLGALQWTCRCALPREAGLPPSEEMAAGPGADTWTPRTGDRGPDLRELIIPMRG